MARRRSQSSDVAGNFAIILMLLSFSNYHECFTLFFVLFSKTFVWIEFFFLLLFAHTRWRILLGNNKKKGKKQTIWHMRLDFCGAWRKKKVESFVCFVNCVTAHVLKASLHLLHCVPNCSTGKTAFGWLCP